MKIQALSFFRDGGLAAEIPAFRPDGLDGISNLVSILKIIQPSFRQTPGGQFGKWTSAQTTPCRMRICAWAQASTHTLE
jgi:hypothetical protein